MRKLFQLTLFLLSLVSFGPRSYASDDAFPSSGGAAGGAPASASALIPQIEEGWRWRESLDVHVVDGDQKTCKVPGQEIHTQLRDREASLRFSGDSNIGVAAITVVFRNGGGLQHKTAWIQNISDITPGGASILGTSPYIFSSNGDQQRRAGSAQQRGAFAPFNSESMRSHLLSFFSPVPQDILPNLLEILISPADDRGFPHDWHHSEQKIIWFLWNCRVTSAYADSQLHQTIKALLEQSGTNDITSIKAVILHVHTQRDPCQRCAAALKVFASKVQEGLRALQGKNANCRAMVTVSGRKAYQGSRSIRGHDGRASDAIKINLAHAVSGPEARIEDPVYVNFQAALVAPSPAPSPGYRLLPPRL